MKDLLKIGAGIVLAGGVIAMIAYQSKTPEPIGYPPVRSTEWQAVYDVCVKNIHPMFMRDANALQNCKDKANQMESH